MANRWWMYQRERFPLLQHGPLVAAFSFCAVSYSGLLRGREALPDVAALFVALVTCLLFFFQLRIADEFKDFDEDAQYRPYRAVPRGLVKLRELGALFVLGGAIQLALALWFHPPLLLLLLVPWIYLALMCKEFFLREWLTARPFTYMWTHMLIMPLVDLYATASDWMPTAGAPPPGLIWFLVMSFFNGFVIEIGRKMRAPEDEEEGVPTYTRVWGRRRAVLTWLVAMGLTTICAAVAAWLIDFLVPVVAVLIVLLGIAACFAGKFAHEPNGVRAKRLELIAGVWTLALYLGLGLLPLMRLM